MTYTTPHPCCGDPVIYLEDRGTMYCKNCRTVVMGESFGDAYRKWQELHAPAEG